MFLTCVQFNLFLSHTLYATKPFLIVATCSARWTQFLDHLFDHSDNTQDLTNQSADQTLATEFYVT